MRVQLLSLFVLVSVILPTAKATARESAAIKQKRAHALRALFVALDDAALPHAAGADAAGMARTIDQALQKLKGTLGAVASDKQVQASLAELELVTREGAVDRIKLVGLRQRLYDSLRVSLAPSQTLNLAESRLLYAKHCAACHGVTGLGDGVLAPKIKTPMPSFADAARMAATSPYRIFNVLFEGRPGTLMPAYGDKLEPSELWELSYYVTGLRHGALPAKETPEAAWQEVPAPVRQRLVAAGLSFAVLTRYSDTELEAWTANALSSSPPSKQDLNALIVRLRLAAPYLKSLPRQ